MIFLTASERPGRLAVAGTPGRTGRRLLTPDDLVMVLLIRDQPDTGQPMPTLTVSQAGASARMLVSCGIRAVKVFASGSPRDRSGAAAGGLMAAAITELKAAVPSLTVITETCLCSWTSTGECHLTGSSGEPDVRGTIEALAAQAVTQADAGADVVGPAAMIPGSVRAVRQALDGSGHDQIGIMPHLIFDSRLYDGYRRTMGAVPASGETRPFQADPARPDAAVQAGLGFVAEGAGMLLLEPAMFCADVLVDLKNACAVPLAPFSVSGEYTRLATGDGDWRLLAELFVMLKRAGADQIITYAAADLAAAMG